MTDIGHCDQMRRRRLEGDSLSILERAISKLTQWGHDTLTRAGQPDGANIRNRFMANHWPVFNCGSLSTIVVRSCGSLSTTNWEPIRCLCFFFFLSGILRFCIYFLIKMMRLVITKFNNLASPFVTNFCTPLNSCYQKINTKHRVPFEKTKQKWPSDLPSWPTEKEALPSRIL